MLKLLFGMGAVSEESLLGCCPQSDNLPFVSSKVSSHCAKLFRDFMELAEKLDVPLAHEKTDGPT